MPEDTKLPEEPKPLPSTPYIDKAEQAAERLEKANAKNEEILKRQEELHARMILSGRSGYAPEPKAETPKEYAARILRGDIKK